jgi:zeaxanthin glucosyltransferase
VPPPYFPWQHASGEAAFDRNRRGNALIERLARPVLALVNLTRREWGMSSIEEINDLFSTRGIITQLPAMLELPRRKPPHLFYTGQFRDERADTRVGFAWDRLDGRPLVYASMGTVRNAAPGMFKSIAAACAPLGVQLVISLGGGLLAPAALGPMPGNPIVVHYAPQRSLLKRATLTVNCGGLNTTLDSLREGVPIVAMPVAEDQPGVGARIARAGVGIVEPAGTITVDRLRDAIEAVLTEPQYRAAARRVQHDLQHINGVEQAVALIEELVRGPCAMRVPTQAPAVSA